MAEQISLKIDGQPITVEKGTTILDAASQLEIDIPVICFSPYLTPNGLCRICSVDVGGRVQVAACVSECQEGLNVVTNSEKVKASRRVILELLDSAVDLQEAPEILTLMESYNCDRTRFNGYRRRESPIYDDNPFFMRDYNQCINCWRCVQVCGDDAQFAYALSFDGRGFETTIGTFLNNDMMSTTCVFCGQCVGVCPTGALKPKRQALLEEGISPDDVFKMTRGRMRKKKPI